MMRGRPLAVRLAVLLAAVVVIVLVAAGVIVNRATTKSLDDVIGPREEQRLNLAVAVIEAGLERGDPRIGRLLERVADQAGGRVRVLDDGGSVRFQAGRPPPGPDPEVLSLDLSPAAGGGRFELTVPSSRAPFLRAFNTALLLAGGAAVAALLVAAVLVARRVTRPLRGVAAAAQRLGAGDLGARATGGPDAESAELAAAFNAMAERLERSEELRRRAASDLAHDLATPATVLESQLQAMIDGVVPADPVQLERARASASALSGVIGQLGELTQAEAAPLQRRAEPFDLGALARDTVAALEGLLREHSVTAAVRGPELRVVADRGQLARAIRNVLTNAIQHSPAGGAVDIELHAEAGAAVLRVRDSGPGIAPEDRAYVFERFYRADRSRGTRPGSGVGLTVARELVAANGGTIELEPATDAGAVFRIVLPAA